jgi:hypothetical protein
MTYRQGQSTYEVPWLVIQEQQGEWWSKRPQNPDHRGEGTAEPERCFLAWPKASELGTRDMSQAELNELVAEIDQEELNELVDEDRVGILFWWRRALFSNVDFYYRQYSYDEKKNPTEEDDTMNYLSSKYIPEVKHNVNERIKESGASSDIYGRIWYVIREG